MEDLYEFSFGAAEDKLSSSNNVYWSTKGLDRENNVQFPSAEDWGHSSGIESLRPNFGFYKDDSSEEGYLLSTNQQKGRQQQSSYMEFGPFENLQFNMVSPSPPLQTYVEDIMKFDEFPTMVQFDEPTRDNLYSLPLASLELFNNIKQLYGERQIQPSDDLIGRDAGRKLSTEDIMRIAGTKFIQSYSESADLQSLLSHPYDVSFSGLSDDEKENVELAEILLTCAEKVGSQQFDRARKLVDHCDSLSSKTGNPLKRVVYYFSEALREKIDRETGRITSKEFKKKHSFDPHRVMMSPTLTSIAIHEGLPFAQVLEYAGVQAIVENVTEARKVHIIDFAIKKGEQWAILMQALQSRYKCPLELLKITAVGTNSKHFIEGTGKLLTEFAQTMNIPFSFKIVMVSEMQHLKEDLFDLDPEEAVAVYSCFVMRAMIAQPHQLESVMRVIRNIDPTLMVLNEVEASHNSTSFVNRLIEALFYYSAFFDCLDTCMKLDDPTRMDMESTYLSHGIRNIVAAEGAERKTRNVKIDVWRAFFARFGMVETKLSSSSLQQAEAVAKRFACASSCTFEMNGSALLVGWKGTPLSSLSVWKFL